MRRSGLALILVVGTLGVLAVLGSAFAILARLERRSAQQRLWATRAALLARSGLEDAQARLCAGQDPGAPGQAFLGEDWDASGTLNGFEAGSEVFRSGVLDTLSCPVRFSLRPSFFVKDPGSLGADGRPAPARQKLDGRERGFTGSLAGGTYALRIEDESSKIQVNGGFLDRIDRDNDGVADHQDTWVTDLSPPPPPGFTMGNAIGRGWNGALVRILNVLGSQSEVGVANLGTLAVQSRPPGGYATVRDLEAAVGTTSDLSLWLTVSSWVDRKVVHPNGFGWQLAWPTSAMSDVKKTRLPLALEEGGRPPVNLNAASRPVLIALVQGLSGACWLNQRTAGTWGNVRSFTPAVATQIVDRLLAQRPFADWQGFSGFCDGLVPSVISGMNAGVQGGGNLEGADLLKANFDPNTVLNKQFPDQLMLRWIDKSDLATGSTEGSLYPTGVFRVSCEGRLAGEGGGVLARRSASALVEAYGLSRHTTQADFVGGRARFESYLSLAAVPHKTTGVSSPAWKTWSGSQGLAVSTYPCAPPAVASGRASELDGCVGLATVEVPNGEAGATFLHHFDDGWDADTGVDRARKPGPGGCDAFLQPDATQSIWPAGAEPSTFLPDGIQVLKGRSVAYRTDVNFPASPGDGTSHGALQFWLKVSRRLTNGVLDCDMLLSRVRMQGAQSQVFMLGRWVLLDKWGVFLENRPGGDNGEEGDRNLEQGVGLTGGSDILADHRWMLASVAWDTDDLVTGRTVDFELRGLIPDALNSPRTSAYGPPLTIYDTAGTQDLFGGPELIVLGTQTYTLPEITMHDLSNTSAVLDELAVMDFTDDAIIAHPAADDWAETCYQDGRYYKGEDATFTSASMAPAGGGACRPLWARWTAYLPSESRIELQGPYQFFPDFHPVSGAPRKVDDRLAASSISLTLLYPDGSSLPLRQGAPLSGPAAAGFQYVASLKSGIAAPLGSDPVLETPFLDDVTFAWQGASGPRFLSWGD